MRRIETADSVIIRQYRIHIKTRIILLFTSFFLLGSAVVGFRILFESVQFQGNVSINYFLRFFIGSLFSLVFLLFSVFLFLHAISQRVDIFNDRIRDHSIIASKELYFADIIEIKLNKYRMIEFLTGDPKKTMSIGNVEQFDVFERWSKERFHVDEFTGRTE